jgi:hypothetical protein
LSVWGWIKELDMSTAMSGLRVFVNPNDVDDSSVTTTENESAVSTVFYSQRGKGPIYRWLYEEKLALWRVFRINTSEFNTHHLSNASWKVVPDSLRAQIGAHYLD